VDTQQHGSGLMAAVGQLRGFAPTTRAAALAAEPPGSGARPSWPGRHYGQDAGATAPRGPRRAPRKGSAVAALPHAKSAMRNLLCQPVPPRRSPDTTSLRLSAGYQVAVKVSKVNRQQRSETFLLSIPRPSQISLDKLIAL